MAQDPTERTTGAEAVHLYERVIDALSERFVIIDCQLKILCVNAAALPKGCVKEDVVGRHLFEIYPNLLRQGFDESIEKAIATGESRTEHHVMHTTVDGTTGFFNRRIVPMSDEDNGIVTSVLIVVEDVHGERVAQLKAQEIEFQYRQLVEKLQLVSFELDATGKFVYVNNAVEQLFGFAPVDLIGQSFSRYLHHDDVGQLWQVFWRIVNEGQHYGVSTNRVIAPDGRIVHMRWNIHPVYDRDGTIVGCRGVGEDVTQEAGAVAELAESRDLFFHAFNAAPIALFVVQNGVITNTNRTCTQLMQWPRDAKSRTIYVLELVAEQERDSLGAFLKTLPERGRASMHITLIRRRGPARPCRLQALIIKGATLVSLHPLN